MTDIQSVTSIDEYADIEDIPIPINSKKLMIQVTQSKCTGAEVPEEKSAFTITTNRSNSINSFLSMTAFKRHNSLETVSTNISGTGTEMSPIATYDTNIHGGLKRALSPVSEVSSIFKSASRNVFAIRKPTDLSSISDGVSVSRRSRVDDIRIMEINCIVYSFNVLLQNAHLIEDDWDIEQFETRINRLVQHFKMMQRNRLHLMIMSNMIRTAGLRHKLKILQLRKVLSDDCVIGYDHKVVRECNASIELMILKLVRHLKIEPNELLFVGNERMNVSSMKMRGICQIYNVKGRGVLKGKHLIFLESRALDGI